MARPKKTATPSTEEKVPEFEYDDSDDLYRQVMSHGAVQQVTAEASGPETTRYFVPAEAAADVVPPPPNLIFLVEGKVRLDQEGAAPIFSDQRRIVNATNVDEAILKFINYFAAMSNPMQRYTAVQVAASETIL